MRATLRKHNIAFRERLAATKLIAILRGQDTEFFPDIAQVLHDCGIRAIETALTTPAALDALATMQVELGPDTLLGAGNVRTVSDVDSCAAAGADFLVTPTFSADVLERAHSYGIPVACGAMTPTEIDGAWRHGAAVVKVFPARQAGGPRYIAAVHEPLPEVPLVPAGGVTLEDVDCYLGSGAFAVGVASPLIGDATCGGRLDELGDRASRFVTAAGKFV
ncbi:MAG TPA: bifunctional 4-hydroxy-2-oxoglutarate aldolase/2-dehydro-3-deoxy-phosphogluconate aldolase [Amycolatopsis sp.]|nr:bifunctional 4-hydroxy-2-oxoglutarate aldolase/2-dehydro-3-deoxy-phosphogluconate aldolase [Amycolatopsis sp.]